MWQYSLETQRKELRGVEKAAQSPRKGGQGEGRGCTKQELPKPIGDLTPFPSHHLVSMGGEVVTGATAAPDH